MPVYESDKEKQDRRAHALEMAVKTIAPATADDVLAIAVQYEAYIVGSDQPKEAT